MPPGTAIFPAHKAPAPEEYDFLALGFWVRKAAPDPRMARYMERVNGKTVAWFGTLAAWPDSPHAAEVRINADALLAGNRIVGDFLCQGRLESRRYKAAMERGAHHPTHPMTEERKRRLMEAAKHPDENDLAAARRAFAEYLSRAAGALL